LIAVLYRGGLRVSEALALKPKDINHKAGTLRVLHGKGDKSRTVGLDDGALAMVAQWEFAKKKRKIKRAAPLFCTLAGSDVKAEYVRAMLKRIAIKAGIDKRVHPHGLRHAHAVELAQEGVPMNLISRQLGHSNLGVTSKYLAGIHPKQVVDAMRGREW
jgi:site-specific recombinase XerD